MTKAAELAKMGEVLTNSQIGGRRNIVINGAMQVAQRGTSAVTGNGDFPVDRVKAYISGSGAAMSSQQSSDAPADFNYSVKYEVTSAATIVDGAARLESKLEGLNTAHLNFGSSDASIVTTSFWVKSSVTGTYSFALQTGADTRAYVTEYTVNSANTWERKTITISGDTSGTWITSNGNSFKLRWAFNSNSAYNPSSLNQWEDGNNFTSPNAVNFIGTNGATFYITGLQLEVGSQATPFEHRSFGEELALCQRYYETSGATAEDRYSMNVEASVTKFYFSKAFNTHKRSQPTVTVSQNSNDNLTIAATSAVSNEHHAGFAATPSGTDDSRANSEFTWAADAEL